MSADGGATLMHTIVQTASEPVTYATFATQPGGMHAMREMRTCVKSFPQYHLLELVVSGAIVLWY